MDLSEIGIDTSKLVNFFKAWKVLLLLSLRSLMARLRFPVKVIVFVPNIYTSIHNNILVYDTSMLLTVSGAQKRPISFFCVFYRRPWFCSYPGNQSGPRSDTRFAEYLIAVVKVCLWSWYGPPYVLADPPCVRRQGLTCASQKIATFRRGRRSHEGCDWSAHWNPTRNRKRSRLRRRVRAVVALRWTRGHKQTLKAFSDGGEQSAIRSPANGRRLMSVSERVRPGVRDCFKDLGNSSI